MTKEQSFQQIVLRQLESYLQMNEVGSLVYTIYKT